MSRSRPLLAPLCASILAAGCAGAGSSAKGASAGGAQPGAGQPPAFHVDPTWPKPLPNGWILGQVSGVAIDAQDHVWVLQRPKSLTDDERGATFDPPLSCRLARSCIEQ